MSTTVNDANFVAVAGELLPGQRVIKIDGRYIPVGIGGNFIPGGGVDFEGVTVTASDILAGVVAVNSSGTKVTGTISTVTPSVTANVFNVRKGYVSRDTELTVPMSNVTETDTAVTITPGYVSRTLVYDLGSDIDFSGVNVTADKMLANSVAINADGDKITGTIATVRATSDGETVVVPVGYIASEQTFQVSGSGYDTSEVTVTADKMLIGYTAVGPDGELIDGEIDNTRLERPGDPNIICINPGYVPEYQEIEIPTVSAEFETQGEDVVSFVVGEGYVYDTTIEIPVVSSIDVDGNRVSVSAGYIKDTLSETIPEADINESSSSVTIGVGYVSEPLTYQLGSGTVEGDTVEYGYITADGKVQKLDLSSGTPAAVGSPVSMSINLIKTGQPEPDYGTGGGGGSGTFDLAKVTEYIPHVADDAVTSVNVSGIGDFIYEEYPEDSKYYSEANGRYIITNETSGESNWQNRIYKHESKEYYIIYNYNEEYPEESTWAFSTSSSKDDMFLWLYSLNEDDETVAAGNLTSGEADWGDFDFEPFTVTLDVTNTVTPETPMVLKGVLATGYTNGEWSFDTAEKSFTGFEETPKVGFIYAVTGDRLIGNAVAVDMDVPAGTVFLFDKSLTDVVGGIQVINHELTASNTGIVCADGKYAEIPAGTLPTDVMCDNKPWTLEIRFRCLDNAGSWSKRCLFGRGMEPSRFDILVDKDNIGIGGFSKIRINANLNDTDWHSYKVTHTSDNVFTAYLDDAVSDSETVSGKNMQDYQIWVGHDGESRYASPFEIEYVRISNTAEL